jgi:chaperonin GroES
VLICAAKYRAGSTTRIPQRKFPKLSKEEVIIPDTAKEKPQQGEIVAVGPGAPDDKGKVQPLDVKPGDRVLFGKWSGTEVKIDGEELLIMKESDILGVLEGAVAKKKAA